MRRTFAIFFATLALLPCRLAQGQTPEIERAKASFRAGANAYAAGDYPAAIQALEAAYELTPLPAIAFSLAQAERKQYGKTRRREHLENGADEPLVRLARRRRPRETRLHEPVGDAGAAHSERPWHEGSASPSLRSNQRRPPPRRSSDGGRATRRRARLHGPAA